MRVLVVAFVGIRHTDEAQQADHLLPDVVVLLVREMGLDRLADHLISLELGGSNGIANLWPEPASPRPGFHEKDKVEDYLHQQVCNGSMSLSEAQDLIAHNWMKVYRKIT